MIASDRRIDAGPIAAIAVDPNEELVACVGNDGADVAVWPIAGGKRVWGSEDIVSTQGRDRLAWSADGKLALACGDGTIRIFDHRGKRTATLGPGRKGQAAMAVAFAPTGELVSGGFDGMARVWHVSSGKQLRKLSHGRGDFINTVRVSSDGIVGTGGQNGEAKLWDLASGKLRTTSSHGSKVEGIAFSRDGALVATAGGSSSRRKEDRWIRVWNVSDGTEHAKLVGTRGENHGLAFLEDGLLAALSFNPDNKTSHSDLMLWDVATRKAVLSVEAPRTTYSLTTARGQLLLGRTGFTGYGYEEPLSGIEIWKRA